MAIVGYEYRKKLNGTEEWGAFVDLGQQLDLSEVIASLPSSTTWDFQVQGYDAEGNRVGLSNIATASTLGLTANAAHMCCTGACGPNVHAAFTNDVTIDTSVVRPNGSHSIRFESIGDGNVGSWAPFNLDVSGLINDGYCVRFYVRYETLPDGDAMLCYAANNPFFGATYFGIAFHEASGTLRLASFYTTPWTFDFEGSGSEVIVADRWYQIDMRWYVDNGDIHCEAQVDEVEISDRVESPVNTSLTQPTILTDHEIRTATTIFRITDFILVTAKGDYPIGPGHIRRYLPAADGNHRIDSTGDFKVGTTGTDIADAATASYQLIDDTAVPENNTAVAGDDFIRQAAAAGGSGTQYVEHTFANPDDYTPTKGPRLVQYLNACHADGGVGSGNGSCRLVDNTTEEIMSDFTAVASNYATAYVARPINIATEGQWRITGSDGNFLALKHRFGHSTGSGADVSLDALMIEAEFAGEEE